VIFDKWLGRSTYGDSESDEDEFHITKPYEIENLPPLDFMKKSSQFEVEEYVDPPEDHDEEDNATLGSIEKVVLAMK